MGEYLYSALLAEIDGKFTAHIRVPGLLETIKCSRVVRTVTLTRVFPNNLIIEGHILPIHSNIKESSDSLCVQISSSEDSCSLCLARDEF